MDIDVPTDRRYSERIFIRGASSGRVLVWNAGVDRVAGRGISGLGLHGALACRTGAYGPTPDESHIQNSASKICGYAATGGIFTT
jgi:hypothetical protein